MSKRSRLVAVLICATLASLGAVWYAHYIDWPERVDEVPYEVRDALGSRVDRISAFYRYDLGGFIDSEYLWRVDADEETINLLADGLKLQSAASIPDDFLRMPPHYWPRTFDSTWKTFSSPGFRADTRGGDGQFYFMLIDGSRHTAFVWYKDNF